MKQGRVHKYTYAPPQHTTPLQSGSTTAGLCPKYGPRDKKTLPEGPDHRKARPIPSWFPILPWSLPIFRSPGKPLPGGPDRRKERLNPERFSDPSAEYTNSPFAAPIASTTCQVSSGRAHGQFESQGLLRKTRKPENRQKAGKPENQRKT